LDEFEIIISQPNDAYFKQVFSDPAAGHALFPNAP
jgi:hypothetical protein